MVQGRFTTKKLFKMSLRRNTRCLLIINKTLNGYHLFKIGIYDFAIVCLPCTYKFRFPFSFSPQIGTLFFFLRSGSQCLNAAFKWLYISMNQPAVRKKSPGRYDFSYPPGLYFCLATSYFRFYTIVGVQWLNFCVRDGNRCDPLAVVTIPVCLTT